jgi:hypothetical protein
MARRNKERATDRLNQALSRISAAADMVDKIEGINDKAQAAAALRTQLSEAVEEAYAALADIRQLAAAL